MRRSPPLPMRQCGFCVRQILPVRMRRRCDYGARIAQASAADRGWVGGWGGWVGRLGAGGGERCTRRRGVASADTMRRGDVEEVWSKTLPRLDTNPLPASCSTFFLVWLDTVHECRHHAGRLPLAWPAQRCLGLPLKGPRPRLGTPPTMSPRRRWSLPPGVDRQVIALARSTLALV
jgi:hypothetical protein